MLIFTTCMFQDSKTNAPSLYCQGSTLPRIIYFGRTPNMECDLLHPNVFHQCFYNLHCDHNNRNTATYYSRHDMQESSRSFTIGPILNEREPLKQIIFVTNFLSHNKYAKGAIHPKLSSGSLCSRGE